MGVGVVGDVCDGVAVADEELVPAQVVLEEGQCLLAALAPADRRGLVLPQPAREETEAEPAEHRHHVRLLEDQPADDPCAQQRLVRQERRVLGEVEKDRVRFLEVRRLVDLQDGRAPGRILRVVLVGEGVAAEDVDRDALVQLVELGQQQPHLVAVGRGAVVVQPQPLRHDSGSLHCSIISCGRDYAAQARRPDSSIRLSAKLSISSRRASFARHGAGIAAAP